MVQNIKLDFTAPMLNFDGKPILNVTTQDREKYKIQTDADVERYRSQLEPFTFADCMNQLFDFIPFKSTTLYALYNGILIEIRVAKTKNQKNIDVTKDDLEKLKELLLNSTLEKPQINRHVSFALEIIENTLHSIHDNQK